MTRGAGGFAIESGRRAGVFLEAAHLVGERALLGQEVDAMQAFIRSADEDRAERGVEEVVPGHGRTSDAGRGRGCLFVLARMHP